MFWEGIRRKRYVPGPFRLSLDISILWLIALLLLNNRMATYSFFFFLEHCVLNHRERRVGYTKPLYYKQGIARQIGLEVRYGGEVNLEGYHQTKISC